MAREVAASVHGAGAPGGCCVPWLGMSLKSLDPLTPRTVTLLWPVPRSLAPLASLGSVSCGIPSMGCASIRPHCWDGDRASHCVLWGSSDQLRAPQSWPSLGNVRVSGFPWQLPWGWWHIPHCALPARCGAAAAGSCSGASRLAGVFIEQISPNCFCCKASASESKDLPGTSRIAPQLSVILSSPALPRGYHASHLPCAYPHPCFLEWLSLSRRGREVLHAPPEAIWHRGWCIAAFGGDPTRSTLCCSFCCNSKFWDACTRA